MQNLYLSSFIFASPASVATTAAPSIKPERPQPHLHPDDQDRTIQGQLNAADAETLRRGLFGIGASKAKAIIAYRQRPVHSGG